MYMRFKDPFHNVVPFELRTGAFAHTWVLNGFEPKEALESPPNLKPIVKLQTLSALSLPLLCEIWIYRTFLQFWLYSLAHIAGLAWAGLAWADVIEEDSWVHSSTMFASPELSPPGGSGVVKQV